MKKLAMAISYLLISSMLMAQLKVNSSVDKREIRIGEPVILQLSVSYPPGVPLQWFSIPDTFNTLEVARREKIDTISTSSGDILKQKILITGFDSGRYVIPAFHLMLDGQDLITDSFSVTVHPVQIDGTDYKDLKDIVEAEQVNTNKYLWWIAGAASLMLLFILIYLMMRNRTKPQAERLINKDAYANAIEQLNQLKKESLIEKGEELQYYTRLADIFRLFLQGERGIHSMEKTTVEILSELQRMDLDRATITEIGIALRRCDFVKFAKYAPSGNEHAATIAAIENTIGLIHQRS
jgi:hypothetical protein